MQPKPAGDERAAEQTDPPPERAVSSAPAREHAETPTLVLRPHLHWRATGPALILFAFLLLAAGRMRAVPVALVVLVTAAAFLPALWERLDVGPTTIHQRSWRGHRTSTFREVDTLRLRRVPFLLLRGVRRGYKFGRYWSVPLTLRLLRGDRVLVELRCGWWNGWRELARYVVVSCPEIDLDGRTRGRLERYVGVPLPPPQE